MDRRLTKLLGLLDAPASTTVGTSARLPTTLGDAAVLAAEMGLVESTTELTANGLRDRLEAFALRAVLDEHYRQHPHVQPDLAEIALAAAELEANPPGRADLIERAAKVVVRPHDHQR